MSERTLRMCEAAALACLAAVCLSIADMPQAARADSASGDVQAARTVLSKYQDPFQAIRDGYFSTVACIDFLKPGTIGDRPYAAGAMGVHFLNKDMIGPAVDPAKPQVLIYEPVGDKLRLAAAEWFVPLATGIKERPHLFGQPFYGPMAGHQPIMPAALTHYDLHVWLWKDNPAGMFSPTNPDLKCPATGYTIHADAMAMPMSSGH
jgi:hypothetical protein